MWYYYRINGGQVLGASIAPAAPWAADAWCAVFESPAAVDLGTPHWCDGATLRPATAGEVAAFPGAAAADAAAAARAEAKDLIGPAGPSNDRAHRLLRALVELVRREINTLRAQHSLADRTAAQVRAALEGILDEE
jgi:hypothetical protein